MHSGTPGARRYKKRVRVGWEPKTGRVPDAGIYPTDCAIIRPSRTHRQINPQWTIRLDEVGKQEQFPIAGDLESMRSQRDSYLLPCETAKYFCMAFL
jgi:hypothetical protein